MNLIFKDTSVSQAKSVFLGVVSFFESINYISITVLNYISITVLNNLLTGMIEKIILKYQNKPYC